MPTPTPPDDDNWLSLLDLSAIADPDDKLSECEYFLTVAASETNRERFRWQISAFFNAAYSYFETSALYAYFSFTDARTGEPVEDSQALEVLRKYVKVFQNAKKPGYVKTAGLHPIAERLYELRKANTHHFPMSISYAPKAYSPLVPTVVESPIFQKLWPLYWDEDERGEFAAHIAANRNVSMTLRHLAS